MNSRSRTNPGASRGSLPPALEPVAVTRPALFRSIGLGRGYVVAWSALAVVAGTYLTTLGLRPDLLPGMLGPTTAPPGQGTLGEVVTPIGDFAGLREAMASTRRDVGEMRTAVVALEDRTRIIASRLATVEDRLQGAPAAASDRSALPGVTLGGGRSLNGRFVQGEVQEEGTAPAPVASAPAVAPRAVAPTPARFGPATVNPAREPVALQLASGPSVDAVRLSWSLLQERHRGQLGRLEPRVVRDEADPSRPSYRLIAGPVTSPEEARRLCTALKKRRAQCEVAESFDGEGL